MYRNTFVFINDSGKENPINLCIEVNITSLRPITIQTFHKATSSLGHNAQNFIKFVDAKNQQYALLEGNAFKSGDTVYVVVPRTHNPLDETTLTEELKKSVYRAFAINYWEYDVRISSPKPEHDVPLLVLFKRNFPDVSASFEAYSKAALIIAYHAKLDDAYAIFTRTRFANDKLKGILYNFVTEKMTNTSEYKVAYEFFVQFMKEQKYILEGGEKEEKEHDLFYEIALFDTTAFMRLHMDTQTTTTAVELLLYHHMANYALQKFIFAYKNTRNEGKKAEIAKKITAWTLQKDCMDVTACALIANKLFLEQMFELGNIASSKAVLAESP